MSFDPYEFDRGMTPAGQMETQGQYTARTFLWMVLGLMVTFGVALACWLTGIVMYVWSFQIVILIATLVMAFTMGSRIERMAVGTAKAMFIAFAVLFGFTISVYLLVFDLPSLILVFLATAVYFAALAAYGHFTRTDLSGLRPILFSGLIFLIIFGLLSMFIPWLAAMDRIACIIGIGVFLAFTAYDTQKIRAYYHYYAGFPDMLEKASIFSALQLYLDFLNLFLYLLRFMGRRRN